MHLRQKLDEKHISDLIKKDADAALQKVCIVPFEKTVKRKVSHITVSSESESHAHLCQLNTYFQLNQREKDMRRRFTI